MSKELVLAVDDERDVLKLLQVNLEKEGYGVLLAEDGRKALEIAKDKRPDLILLDLMLPEIDGFEVCRLLKAGKDTQDIPVLMLTAKSSEADQVVGLELGAADYLTKPFSMKVLLTRLKNILKNRTECSGPVPALRCCELSLDREKQRFEIKGKPVALTKTEFKILSVFMDSPQALVASDRLIASVWGRGSFVSRVAVNMQIKNLRGKLGRYRHHIETVRGSGYRFC